MLAKTRLLEREFLVSKMLFLTCKKIKYMSLSHYIVFFLLYLDKLTACTNNHEKGENGINILTTEDIENWPRDSQM